MFHQFLFLGEDRVADRLAMDTIPVQRFLVADVKEVAIFLHAHPEVVVLQPRQFIREATIQGCCCLSAVKKAGVDIVVPLKCERERVTVQANEIDPPRVEVLLPVRPIPEFIAVLIDQAHISVDHYRVRILQQRIHQPFDGHRHEQVVCRSPGDELAAGEPVRVCQGAGQFLVRLPIDANTGVVR